MPTTKKLQSATVRRQTSEVSPALNDRGNQAFREAAAAAIAAGIPARLAYRGGVGSRAKHLVLSEGKTTKAAVTQAVREAVTRGWPRITEIISQLSTGWDHDDEARQLLEEAASIAGDNL